MLSNKEILIPKKLIKLAKKTPFVTAGIVCPHSHDVMNSTKEAYDLGLINPVFIGERKKN